MPDLLDTQVNPKIHSLAGEEGGSWERFSCGKNKFERLTLETASLEEL